MNEELVLDARVQKEISSLVKVGYHVVFCGWDKKDSGKETTRIEEIRGNSIECIHIHKKVVHRKGLSQNLIPLIQYENELYQWLKKNSRDIDIVHACNLETALVASLFAKRFHKKLVYDIFDDCADCHPASKVLYKMIKNLDSKVISKADAVIICSEKRKEQISGTPKKLVVVHNSPDIKLIDVEKYALNDTKKYRIAYCGLLTDGRLIKELMKIVSRHNDWVLYIGGDGDISSDVVTMSKKYSNIKYLGRIPYEQVLAVEAQCDVIPALYDPAFKNHKFAAPNKFYEAMYLGKPTIMAHNTGMDDVVDKYHSGLTINFNEEELEVALCKIKNELLEWQNNSNMIKSTFNNEFSWETMENRLLEIYKTI